MTAVLIIAVILVALGMFAIGVASGPSVRGAWWRLDDKRREARRQRANAPAPEAEPVTARHDVTRESRSTLLGPAETTEHADPYAIPTADGEHVTCPACGFRDGRHNPAGCRRQDTLYRRAEGDPFTGEMPKLTDEAYEELRAERPPTIEELREEYARWRNPALTALNEPDGVREVLGALTEQAEREMRADYFDGVRPDVPAYGVDRCEAVVDEAQRREQAHAALDALESDLARGLLT